MSLVVFDRTKIITASMRAAQISMAVDGISDISPVVFAITILILSMCIWSMRIDLARLLNEKGKLSVLVQTSPAYKRIVTGSFWPDENYYRIYRAAQICAAP